MAMRTKQNIHTSSSPVAPTVQTRKQPPVELQGKQGDEVSS